MPEHLFPNFGELAKVRGSFEVLAELLPPKPEIVI